MQQARKKKNQHPKKRGRKPKAEREQWLKEKEAAEAALPIYEKKIEHQPTKSSETWFKEEPLAPMWGVKKNSDGKNVYWFGYKAHLTVSMKSQYLLAGFMAFGNLHDSKAAIPLLKKSNKIYRHNLQAIIPYNQHNEGKMIDFDEHFAPTCVLEHSYRYDSFDARYNALKYTRPKECASCP